MDPVDTLFLIRKGIILIEQHPPCNGISRVVASALHKYSFFANYSN